MKDREKIKQAMETTYVNFLIYINEIETTFIHIFNRIVTTIVHLYF